MAIFRCGSLDQIVHQAQSVLFIPQVAEGIIAVALLQIHQIQDPDIVAVLLQPAACGKEDLTFGVCDNIIGVSFQNVRFHIAPALARTGTADHQHV